MKVLLTLVTGLLVGAGSASALTVNWIDWQTSQTASNGTFTATGQIVSGSETINVTYQNPQGVAFFQDGVGDTNYFTPNTDVGSPYTSSGPNGVDNRPTAGEMIALRFAGNQTISFDKTVENLYYAFVSMNGNGYAFSQDFEVMSFTGGNQDGQGVDSAGFWGSGGVVRVDNGDGTYSLNATGGEPHGVVRFGNKFDTLTWTSLTNEFWNGFTIGVQGTDAQVPTPGDGTPPGTPVVPLPATGWMMLAGLAALAVARRRRLA